MHTDERCGIWPASLGINASGTSLSEQVMFGDDVIGLQRQIRAPTNKDDGLIVFTMHAVRFATATECSTRSSTLRYYTCDAVRRRRAAARLIIIKKRLILAVGRVDL